MTNRPISVTIIASLLIASGVFGFAVHIKEFVSQPSHLTELWIPILALLPVVFGVFILLGHSWARWLALAWMAFHVAISFFDSLQKVAAHVILVALIAYCLFHADARAYFRHQADTGT